MKFFISLILLFLTIFSASSVFAQAATLSLSPSTGTFNKGCPVALQINLNTGGAQTDGTDVILSYDISKFNAVSIASGSIYSDYPGNNIDATNGRITVSGLASVTSPFSGSGVLATVNLQVLEAAVAGATQIKFDFDPANKAKTTDSNVVERGTVADILNSVTNGSYTIGTGTCVAGATPTPAPGGGGGGGTPRIGGPGGGVATPSGTVTPIPADISKGGLPQAGTEQFTFTLVIIGSVLTILGIFGLVLL